MLASSVQNVFAWSVDNWGTNPSNTYGTSVVPGASDAEGSWTQVLAALTYEARYLKVIVHSGATSTAAKPHLLDIGVDPAGGTSYTAIISNVVCGQSQTPNGGGGYSFGFWIYIPAGSTVAARVQGSNATAGTVRVAVKAFGLPSRPEMIPMCTITETIGTITGSSGVTITPGNAADGAWTSIGTNTYPLKSVQLAVQQNNATTASLYYWFELAVGDGTNYFTLIRLSYNTTSTESVLELTRGNLDAANAMVDIPAGSTLYVRGRCSAAPDSGWSAVAIGMSA